MAQPELIRSIAILSKRIDALINENKTLNDKVNSLQQINEELQRQHSIDSESLMKANKEIEFLKLSHRLAQSPEALVEARQKIASLIRNIDICIRLIADD